MACAAGKVDSNKLTKEIEQEMLGVVVRGKFEQALLENSKDPKASSAKTPSTEAKTKTKAETKSEAKPEARENRVNVELSPSTSEAAAPVDEGRSSCCNMFQKFMRKLVMCLAE